MQPLIDVRHLHFSYPDGTAALKGVSFQLFPSETVVLLGPNGSGKTTFVLHLNGILQGEGQVAICGMPVATNTIAAIRRKVGLVFQDSDEQLFMPTVLEDVAFGLLNLGLGPAAASAQAQAALEQVGMAAAIHRAPYHLSAGEKRRVAIAGVLAMQPEILVLDEPTTFLDPPGQRSLIELLRGLPQSKIVVTHNTTLARGLAGRAVFFENGGIAADGPLEDVIRTFRWDARESGPL